jgi:hypothetical protein
MRARVIILFLCALALPAWSAPQLFESVPGDAAKAARSGLHGNPRAVRFNAAQVLALRRGESAELTLPDGTRHGMVTDLVQDQGRGIRSWIGHIQGLAEQKRVIVTSGPGGSYGAISTPQGEFRLIPGPGHDWLVDMKVEGSFAPRIHVENDQRMAPRESAKRANRAQATVETAVPGVNTPFVAKSGSGTNAVVDLLVAYTQGFAASLGSNLMTRINFLVTRANTAYADSGVAITLRLAGTMQVAYSDATGDDQALDEISPACPVEICATPFNASAFGTVETTRNALGADLVTLLRGGDAFGGSGIAWVSGTSPDPDFLYSVVTGCLSACEDVFIHELGHNMGNVHDRPTATFQSNPPLQGAYPYSFGYAYCATGTLSCDPALGSCGAFPECSTGSADNFADIMSYFNFSIPENQRPYRFSNPLQSDCRSPAGSLATHPCGIADADPNAADTAGSMNNMRMTLSAMKSATVVIGATREPVQADFNGDGRADLVFSKADNSLAIWLMNGTQVLGSATVLGPASGTTVTKVGDFDGDGKTDLVRQFSDGSIVVYFLDGAALAAAPAGLSNPQTVAVANANWTLVNVGDFNGDGKTDMVIQDSAGGTEIWRDVGSQTQGIMSSAVAAGWYVSKVADFNGDGKSDLLWTNATGGIGIWTMDGFNAIDKQVVFSNGSGWKAIGTGDFNGDGKADVLFLNTTNGAIGMWLMNGTQALAKQSVFTAATGWSITQVADFNADGKSDLLWTYERGDTGLWLMDGLFATNKQVIQNAGTGWLVTMTEDVNGDGKQDLLWTGTDGSTAGWLMNGMWRSTAWIVQGAGTGWTLDYSVAPNNN